MEGGTDIADIARPLADAMFNRWGRNVTAYSLMDGKIVGEVRRLAARFVFDLFLGKNQVDIEDVVAWQEEYEYYSRTLGSLPIPLEGTPYAAACSRFRRIADAVRNAKWFQRRLFSQGLTNTGPEHRIEVSKRFAATVASHAYPLLSGLLVNSIAMISKHRRVQFGLCLRLGLRFGFRSTSESMRGPSETEALTSMGPLSSQGPFRRPAASGEAGD